MATYFLYLRLNTRGGVILPGIEGSSKMTSISEPAKFTALSETQEKYFAVHGKKPILAVFHRVLKTMNFRYKKKNHFAEQQLRADIKKTRRIH